MSEDYSYLAKAVTITAVAASLNAAERCLVQVKLALGNPQVEAFTAEGSFKLSAAIADFLKVVNEFRVEEAAEIQKRYGDGTSAI